MLVVLSLVGAIGIGLGWVLQHRAVDPAVTGSKDQSLFALMRRRVWWGGIAAMAVGQTCTGIALQFGPLPVVAPIAATNLLWAFAVRAFLLRHRPPAWDVVAALLFAAAVGGFVFVGGGHVTQGHHPAGLVVSVVVTGGVAVMAGVLLLAGVPFGPAVASVAAALAAGLLYALQDVGTRGAMILLQRDGVVRMLVSVWPYLLLASATVAVLFTQRAFRTARLDFAVPPIAVAQPVLGVVLGVLLLDDALSVTRGALAVEAACTAVLVGSTVRLARSRVLAGED